MNTPKKSSLLKSPGLTARFRFLSWQKLLYVLAALPLVALSVPAEVDCVGTEDPVTHECVPYEEDPRLLPPSPYRSEYFEVPVDPYCDIAVKYPVFSIPVLDERIKNLVMGRFESARAECLSFDDTTPEDERYYEMLHIDYTVLRPSGCVLAVYFDIYSQGGGGPPYWSRSALNYDLARHAFLNLEDLFEDADALEQAGHLGGTEPYFLIPDGIVTHSHSGLGGPGPMAIGMEQLQPYRPIQRYWDRAGCDSP